MSYGTYTLFSGQSADGDGSVISWPGGRGSFSAWGTFGGGTVKLQFRPAIGANWIDVDASGDTNVTFTGDGVGGFELPAGDIRAVLSGSTNPTLSAQVQGLRF